MKGELVHIQGGDRFKGGKRPEQDKKKLSLQGWLSGAGSNRHQSSGEEKMGVNDEREPIRGE